MLCGVTSASAFPGCRFVGPALPGSFADTALLRELAQAGLWPAPGQDPLLHRCWRTYRRGLGELRGSGSEIRVRIRVLLPLVKALGYARMNESRPVPSAHRSTHGGYLLSGEGVSLRAFCAVLGADLDAPSGGSCREARSTAVNDREVSPYDQAQWALAALGEPIALLTNGRELRLLLRWDGASYVGLPLGDHAPTDPPPWYLLLHGLCAASALPEVSRRLTLVRHRRTLQEHRELVSRALESFLHFLLVHPANHRQMSSLLLEPGDQGLLQVLFQEGTRLMSRLLVALVTSDAARLLPLGPLARALVTADGCSEDRSGQGPSLERALRELLGTAPGGARSAEAVDLAPTLWGLCWGERAAAYLIDGLLGGQQPAAPVRYDGLSRDEALSLGESLSELEPDIARTALHRGEPPGQEREEIPPGRLYLRPLRAPA